MSLTHASATAEVDCTFKGHGVNLAAEGYNEQNSQILFLCMREFWMLEIAWNEEQEIAPMNGLFGRHVPLFLCPNDALKQLLLMEERRHGQPQHQDKLAVVTIVIKFQTLFTMIKNDELRYDANDNRFFKWMLRCPLDLMKAKYVITFSGTRDAENTGTVSENGVPTEPTDNVELTTNSRKRSQSPDAAVPTWQDKCSQPVAKDDETYSA